MLELCNLFDQLLEDQDLDESILPAVCDAMATADASRVPQTVYHAPDASEASWAHTWSQSRRLERARVFITILPSGFFANWA